MSQTNNKPKLIFPRASEKVGRPHSMAQYDKVDPNIACRELIQNSLDACIDSNNNEDKCNIIFNISKLSSSKIPGFNEYQKTLDRCLETWKDSKQTTHYLKKIKKFSQKKRNLMYSILLIMVKVSMKKV